MASNKLLYQRSIKINDKISILIPTVGEVVDNEDEYYGVVTALTAMPIDFMVQLDDIGIDFSTINEWELFLLLFRGIKDVDTSLVFDNMKLSSFEVAENTQTNELVIIDRDADIVIDRALFNQIAAALRKVNHIEPNMKQPANEEARAFMLQRARTKARRARGRRRDSELENLIIALVNTEEFKYNFETIRDISIYQFNESVRQVIKKVDYNNRMHGVYAGTVDVKRLSQDDLNWLVRK